MEGTIGTQFATDKPASCRAAATESSFGSLNSQIPMASKPAAAYARRSSLKVALIVEISDNESFTELLMAGGPSAKEPAAAVKNPTNSLRLIPPSFAL